MIAVDTNIVLRLILSDDDKQLAAILSLMQREILYIPLTVMLETGWVLASRYAMSRSIVADALRGIVALDRVEVARSTAIRWAIDRYDAGADWADAIHVVASTKLGRFASLDRRLTRQAGEKPLVAISVLH